MTEEKKRSPSELEAEIRESAEAEGLMLNPDPEILEGILEGLLINEERFGYWACPCRRPVGDLKEDADIICPCEYRDADLKDYGRCYCALYVTRNYLEAGAPTEPIPERRLAKDDRSRTQETEGMMENDPGQGRIKTWRCRVCGYLCARPEPPPVCPICRAGRERFEEYRPC
jgi:ferredoxin-thioredoxin reductase catalytic chain